MKKSSLTFALLIMLVTVFGQPSGTIIAFAGPKNKIPAGWVICDGKLFDRTNRTYTNLFNAIGVSWGGDGGNRFAVPDLRGQFLRGVTETSATDPNASDREKSRPDLNSSGNGGNTVGSKQSDTVEVHNHPLTNVGFRNDNLARGRADFGGAEFTNFDAGQGLKSVNNLLRVDLSGGLETRPKNAYVYYIIKL